MQYILSQVLIGVSTCIYLISLILKTKQKMLILQVCSSILFFSHYFLLNANLAGFISVIETIRLIVFFFIDKSEKLNISKTRIIACVSFSLFSVVVAIFNWSLICLLPLIATIIVNVTLSFKNVNFYRIGTLVYCVLTIVYLFAINSLVGGFSQCIVLIFSIIGIINAKKRKDNEVMN